MVRGSTTNDRPVWRLDYVLWALVAAVVSLVGWLTLLPGEITAGVVFFLLELALGVWVTFVLFLAVAAERGSTMNFVARLGGHVLVVVLAWLAVWSLPRTWYVPWLVDVRLALCSPTATGTHIVLSEANDFFGSNRTFVRASTVHGDGSATVLVGNVEMELPPRPYHIPYVGFSCPAYDGWYYVHRMDT
jgi:hypothetical protein